MSSFSGHEAGELFNRYVLTISEESDRGAVLAAAALLDVGLETALKKVVCGGINAAAGDEWHQIILVSKRASALPSRSRT